MKLYFENAYGTSRVIAEVATEQEARAKMIEFIASCNKNKPKTRQFKSYYTRSWVENGKTWFDVGSHSEFFYVDKELKLNE